MASADSRMPEHGRRAYLSSRVEGRLAALSQIWLAGECGSPAQPHTERSKRYGAGFNVALPVGQ
jgi:hypothetical protein